MKQHFIDNDLDPAQHELHEAAVAAESGTLEFCESSDPSNDYGQHVAMGVDPTRPDIRTVAAVGINDLLARHDRVDLIDIDIQRFERFIVPAGIAEMSKRVKRMFVAIHEPDEIAAVATLDRRRPRLVRAQAVRQVRMPKGR